MSNSCVSLEVQYFFRFVYEHDKNISGIMQFLYD